MEQQQNQWAGPPAPPSPSTSVGLIIGLVMGGVIMLVLVVAAGVFGYAFLKRNIPPAAGEPNEIVLRQEPGTGPAMRYGSTPVYDACSLVTIDGLARLGVTLSRDYFISHEHLDADVPQEAAIAPGLSGPVSACFYMLGSEDSLHVRVHQTPFNSADELRRMHDRVTFAAAPVRSESGLSSASWHDDKYETQHILVWRPELVVDISVRTDDSDGTLDIAPFAAKLETLVRSGLSSAPTAPVRHTYAAPFDRVKDPCQIASAKAFAAAFPSASGTPAMVDGSYTLDAPAPASRRGTARQAELSCTRSNIVTRGSLNKDQHRALQVDLSVWDRKSAADSVNAANCAPTYKPQQHSAPIAVTPAIGTSKSCLADYESDWLLKFQANNVNITVSDGDTGPKPDSSVRLGQLQPAAQAIASDGLCR